MKNKNIMTKTQKEVADTVIFPSSLDGQIKISGGENGIIVKPLPKAIPVELPVILQITKIIDALADEYSNEQKLAYMGNDQKTISENDIKINTLMELKRVIDKSNLSK